MYTNDEALDFENPLGKLKLILAKLLLSERICSQRNTFQGKNAGITRKKSVK